MTLMRSAHLPLVLAALATVVLAAAISFTPFLPGDVAVARAVQSLSPHPEWWARPISDLAPAPGKYVVMAVVVTAAFFIGGWRGLVLLGGFLLLEQYGAEYTKAWFRRPRPSPNLIAVVGSPTGYTFPSTTMTFLSVTFGSLGLIALVNRKAPNRWPIIIGCFALVAAGGVARVALGAHWPSDVIATVAICMLWVWAVARYVLRAA